MNSLKSRGKSLALPGKSASAGTSRSAAKSPHVEDDKIWKFDLSKIHAIEANKSGKFLCFKQSRKTKEGAIYSTSSTLTEHFGNDAMVLERFGREVLGLALVR